MAEIKQLTKDVSPRLAAIIWSLFWTAARISEFINIKMADCTPGSPVRVRISCGKGGKERVVYLPKKIYEKDLKLFQGREYLVETHLHTQLNRHNVSREITRAAKRVLGKRISAHTLRHSMAMWLKDEKKLSPDQIAKYLGHSSVVQSSPRSCIISTAPLGLKIWEFTDRLLHLFLMTKTVFDM